MSENEGTALVVGGGGRLGRALVRLLREDGRPVRVLDLVPHPDPDVQSIVGDLADPGVAARACAGIATVFQTAALVDWSPNAGPRVHRVNVVGNRAVLQAARAAGVARFVYTSSMDVVFDGSPIAGGDESIPYPAHHLDPYSETKTIAEQEVLAADDPAGMRTAAVRPTGVFGPGDRLRFDPFVDMARTGTVWALGSGTARMSFVYVDNCAHLHRVVERALVGDAPAAGRAWFSTDLAAPVVAFQLPFLEALGLPFRRRHVPAWACRVLGRLGEFAWHVPGPHRRNKPLFTRYTMAVVLNDFWFVDDRARTELGYTPLVPLDEAMARTRAWFTEFYAA